MDPAWHGEGGIRTLDTGLSPYDGLANRCLQPLGHLSKQIATRVVFVDGEMYRTPRARHKCYGGRSFHVESS